MSTVEVHVWYDRHGKITAVGRPHPSHRERIVALPTADRAVISAKIAEEKVAALHRTHVVDVNQRKLAPAAS